MSSLKAKLGSIQQVAEKRILRLERALPILVLGKHEVEPMTINSVSRPETISI